MLENKNILVGVSGSIASYKACEIVRLLQKKGANVRVCMTPSALEFVGRLTFQALTGEDVYISWKDGKTGLEHITLARWADVFLIAPASANTIAKLRFGITDNFLTSLALAYNKPIVIAPAMNTKMHENPATQENLKVLKERGHIIVNPSEGILACGEEGTGKLADLEDIILAVKYAATSKLLKGKRVLITAGGTREYFDPIRYISNASSGQMGYLLAESAYCMGADVVVISAPTCLKLPSQIKKIDVVSAQDMFEKVKELYQEFDIIIMNAAVADFRPQEYSSQKLKKDKENPVIQLQPNPDILKFLGENKRENQILVGFAAESDNLYQNAVDKLKGKNLDFIVANPVKVFSQDFYEGMLINKSLNTVNISAKNKENAAFEILKIIFS
ncbi:bifunctional phosphopantothenoylcysteine decarboxylase/phosphopantothenate--cysteine ligase CoaBC [Sulfurihydrogenibium azorense]|uniref:bifunctional phosphopantothenoylcysteine decarboxylase/phosphopantothenate--cysteine ligase CoaBC n=1 Tax=Sulfurihydrogenibium azorense TaxID=309806 RepID=UPI002409E2DB|nr:bifunctional phosphopantothenoylcysteine decarboxylase/phosphopantothenate--cysteine ligase CoaBC [Sulfurihydrogenibium azorense]MDM7274215.1 bifunctional phosphopantothenoylcysteine decarboxylase/phosphopantothenate--cysteine ligase CoaBC [Sulfurihydrogenibium azorense]